MTAVAVVELTNIFLKNNYFDFINKTFKQKWGPVIGTKLALPILLMTDLEELLPYDMDLKPYIW